MKLAYNPVILEWAAIGFWFITGYIEFVAKKKIPRLIGALFWLPGKFLRLMLIVMTLGLLAGCTNPDPLAVASGPVFALNAGHWQPAAQDLGGPPAVVQK
jgi:hypothetical protein